MKHHSSCGNKKVPSNSPVSERCAISSQTLKTD